MPESSWHLLGNYLVVWYDRISRLLRKKYKWPPQIIDGIELGRLVTIFKDVVDEESKEDFDEEDLE